MPQPTRRRRPTGGSKSGLGSVMKAAKKRKPTDEWDEDKLLAEVPGGLAAAFVNARLHDKSLALAGLGEPTDWDGPMPEIPQDVAAEDHDTLSNLMADFATAHSTAIWWASKSYVEHGFYDQIVDYLEATVILGSQESNESKRKAEAATSPPVVAAKALAQSAYSDYVRFRDLAKTLKVKHATVSRVGGFVGDDTEVEDQDEAPKRSSRGQARMSGRGTSRGGGRIRGRK